MNKISRRSMLKGSAAVAAGASIISFGELFNYDRVFAQAAGTGDEPATILNLAATAETFACTHYYNAIMSRDALKLTDKEVSYLKMFLDSELKHKQFLEANGAKALATSFYVPTNLFTDRNVFLTTSDTAESWFVAAYLAGIRRFAELTEAELPGHALLAATTAQVMGVEAEHQALLREMNGLAPSNYVLKQALFYNTSEVAPLFAPFLNGADGFTGPAAFPGVDAITALVGTDVVLSTAPFITLTNGMGVMAMMTPEATPMMAGGLMIAGNNVNVRQSPDTNAAVSGSLTNGQQVAVIGQTKGSDGATWYQVQNGWVRSDVVTTSGDASMVPMVTATP